MKNPISTNLSVSNFGNKNNSSECYKCHQTGHFARECTSSEQGGGYRRGRGGNSRSSPRDFGNKNNSSECYKCHQTGHFARECTSSEQGGGYHGGSGGNSQSSPRDMQADSADYEDGSDSDHEKQANSDDSDDGGDSESSNEAEDVPADSADGGDSDSDNVKQDKSEDSESEDESESESASSSEDKEDEFDHKWEEFRNDAPNADEITRRIAVCNMDWDRIRAVDLLVCFNSFKPADSIIHSVKIYPSEYGLKRMEEEKLKGPHELVEKTLPEDQEEVEDKKSSKYHREKLRQYQLNRLKYYYAVIDCDSPETANAIYEQLNGMEYESSSVRFDLRFIPDDITFDHEPTSVAEKVPAEYKPRLFVTSALQQVKVNLTWDETDPKRTEFFQKVFTDLDSVQDDINDYLASASSESEEEETGVIDDDNPNKKKEKTKDRIAKYKELLKSIEEKERKANEEKVDIEITWEPALEANAKEKVKRKMKKESLNPFEEMLLKKKEHKKKDLKKQIQDKDSEEDSEGEASEEAGVIDDDNPNEKNEKTNDRIAEFKKVLKYVEEKEKKANEEKFDKEITWDPTLEAMAKEKVKEKIKEKMKNESLNPFEEMLLKKKEQKKRKKRELKKQTQDEDSEEHNEEEASEISNEKCKKDKKLAELALISDYKNETESPDLSSQKKKKKKKDKSDELAGFVADMDDPRFSAMHTSSLFNVVSAEPHKKHDFSLKRPKEKKSNHHDFKKNNKKAKYH